MIDRPYRTMVRPLSRVGQALALFVPLLLAACGTSQATERADSADDVRKAPVAGALVDRSASVTRAKTPNAAPKEGQVTPTTDPTTPMVPDFRLPDLDGQTWALSQFRGQPVMLFFWATW
jgi:cytochrome oxidase Cu insertion factor (SCO1/SenC/PrrC family)